MDHIKRQSHLFYNVASLAMDGLWVRKMRRCGGEGEAGLLHGGGRGVSHQTRKQTSNREMTLLSLRVHTQGAPCVSVERVPPAIARIKLSPGVTFLTWTMDSDLKCCPVAHRTPDSRAHTVHTILRRVPYVGLLSPHRRGLCQQENETHTTKHGYVRSSTTGRAWL